jgi:dihydrofolate reductase
MSHIEMKFNAIVAMGDKEKGIGKNNDLPWRIPEDHDYYLRVVNTTQDESKTNAVILGRLTWESLPRSMRPIGRCLNIIVSRTMKRADIECGENADLNSVVICGSLEEAKRLVRENYMRTVETIWCLGGSGLYKESFECDDFNRLYLTRVFGEFECDVFLQPKNFLDSFRRVDDSASLANDAHLYKCDYNEIKKNSGDNLEYIFEIYEKI